MYPSLPLGNQFFFFFKSQMSFAVVELHINGIRQKKKMESGSKATVTQHRDFEVHL